MTDHCSFDDGYLVQSAKLDDNNSNWLHYYGKLVGTTMATTSVDSKKTNCLYY